MKRGLLAKQALRVAFDMDYVDHDCFEESLPIKTPALTLHSQLV